MQKTLADADFKNIYYQPGEKPVFCYRFGMTVYEEVFDAGRLVAAGWNTSGYPLNVLEGLPTRLDYNLFAEPQAFDVEVNGRSLACDWEFVDFFQQEESEPLNGHALLHGTITLRSRILPLLARVHTLLDGTAVMTRYFTLENQGDQPMNISAIAPLCGGMEAMNYWETCLEGGKPDIEKLYSLGTFDAAGWGQEGLFRWHALPDAGYSVYGRYRRDRHRHPLFLLRNNALGHFFFAQLGWAGGYAFHFDLNRADEAWGMERVDRRARLAFTIALDSPKPLLVLQPGETFETPRVHIGCIQGNLDDAVNAMHAHIRASVFTLPAARGVRGWVEAGVGPARVLDFPALQHAADKAAAVGVEALIVDAGWSCPAGTEIREWHRRCGDWLADPEKYGDDFAAIRQYVHDRGMLFGLWMDAERLGNASRAFQEHPEWMARRYVDGMRTSMLDMSRPEVVQWVEGQISHLVEAYKIDLFRLDFNVDSPELFHKIRCGETEACGTLRYYQQTQAMYRRLRLKYPDVVFENCAGGGGRTDLAFVSNFSHTWVSDWQIAPRSLAITNGMTMALPPEWVDRLVGGMNSHTRASLDFQVRNTLFGRPTVDAFNAQGSEMNPPQVAFVRHCLDLYKSFIRPHMNENGRIYHHTPELHGFQPTGQGILERASADGKWGVIGVFNLADCKTDAVRVFPRGLDVRRTYDVTFDNSGASVQLSGYAMINEGIRVGLAGALTSELILYRAVD